MKKLVSFLLAVVITVSLFTTLPISSSATEIDVAETSTSKTREEAIAWAKSQVGKSIDTDNFPKDQPYQCVDFIVAYYKFLGVTSPGGNGEDYATNKLPSGWTRIKGAKPEKGDILVYVGSTYGHVGIYESDYVSYHQNFDGYHEVRKCTYKYNALIVPYWGVVRPNFSTISTYNIKYNANGGTGTMSASTITSGSTLNISTCKFTRDGYYFAGYNCCRKSDNTWYTDTAGWKTNAEIYKNGYTKKLYKPGNIGFGNAWTNGASVGDTFTFHAIWLKNKPLISFYDNISGSNYISSSLDNKDIFAVNFVSRDTSVHTLSIDTTDTLNNQNSLKIVSTTAGSTSSKDFAIKTNTNDGMAETGKSSDGGNMVMTFYAKANKEGTQMNLRWGYSSDIHTVTLTTQWKTYSVTMPKTIYYGSYIHGYLDRAATVHMNNIVVAEKYSSSYLQEDGSLPIEIEYTHGETFKELPAPERQGYTFLGWYTKNVGGTRVDVGSQVPLYDTKLYAQWEKTFSQTPAGALETLDGKLYECYDNALSWEDAKAHCESLGGHLVTINSEEENTIVLDLIKDSGRFAWIGASYNTESGCWEWITGENFEYTNWITGQPSNSQTNPEYYAQMMPFNTGLTDAQGKWNDAMGGDGWFSHYGKKNASYICEYETGGDEQYPTVPTENTEPTDNTEPTIEPPVPYLPLGDTDGDGYITILDATVIQRYLAELPNNVFADICADTDKDGVITILDATQIQRLLAQIIEEF